MTAAEAGQVSPDAGQLLQAGEFSTSEQIIGQKTNVPLDDVLVSPDAGQFLQVAGESWPEVVLFDKNMAETTINIATGSIRVI